MSSIQKQEEVRFRDHIRRLSVRSFPGNNDGFDDELTELGKVDHRVRSNLDEFYTASLGSSMAKNRFDDVKPNEQTIVRLRPISKRGDGTYINANYIDARKTMGVPFVYIATQAPMHNTILDFWRMVYENDVAFIVMLCAAKENGKVKSETYWPALGQVYDLGLLSVAALSENVRSDSVHRTLLLRTIRGDEKEVYHMQYLAWPDQGIPTTSIPLMEMIQAMGKSRRSVESPIVVHCSGGIGRTGVFIGMHIALAQFQLEQSGISIMHIVRFMKLCRSGMVQRKDQYIYLYYSVQREMERMILSAERRVNLLDIRPRDKPILAQSPAETGIRARLVAQPRVDGFLAGPPMHSLPGANRSLWSSETLSNVFHSTQPGGAMRARTPAVSWENGKLPHHPKRGSLASASAKGRKHRDVVTDMAAMEDYLRRNPSMRARVELSASGLPESRLEREAYAAKGGKSYRHHHNNSNKNSRCGWQSPSQTPSPERSRSKRATPPPPPRPADAAARTKLEAELLRIQSINQRMRFTGEDRQGNDSFRSPARPQLLPGTPLSIARDTPRTQR